MDGEYGVRATFNVSHLSSFDVGDEDSWTNPFKGGEDVEDNETNPNAQRDPLTILEGPITRNRAKRLKGALLAFVRENVLGMEDQANQEQQEPRLINLTWVDLVGD
jgi:hypothetical protein